MKTNVTYIVSYINKALAFEWVAEYLDKEKFNLHFILLNNTNSDLERFLISKNIGFNRINYNGKKDIISSIFKTIQILKKTKTEVVHTHLFDANIVGLTAAKICGIKKRIHTRHHSNYHHVYFPKAIKYDRFVNYLSSNIVAITQVVKQILIEKEGVNEKKIDLIHHGFKLDAFNSKNTNAINLLKQKYNPNNQSPVIGVISRYTEWKGIQYIIPAFKLLLEKFPNALLVLANADGDYKTIIKKSLENIPQKNYIEIPFEKDIFSLYHVFDMFVHVPISKEMEAFGQIYVEALTAGIPSIFTLSGIANEFVIDKKNALVVDYKNSQQIYESVVELIENKEQTLKMIENGKKSVQELFNLALFISKLEKLYLA